MRKLAIIRKNMGFHQNELADYLGITLSAYQFYEYGTRDGSIENWLNLEKLLGVPVKELYEETDGETI